MSTSTARVLPHRPTPGVHPVDGGVTVAVHAAGATAVWLCLTDGEGGETRVELPPFGDGWWGGFVPDVHPGRRYGLRADGPWDPAVGHRFDPAKLLLDPWGRAVEGTVTYDPAVFERGGESAPFVPRNVVLDTTFDWGDDAPPAHPRDARVVYEVHVREMTRRLPGVPERRCSGTPGSRRVISRTCTS